MLLHNNRTMLDVLKETDSFIRSESDQEFQLSSLL